MNKINLNAQLLPEWPPEMLCMQRGLFYGDGFYESIRVFEGQVPFMSTHWKRLVKGLGTMGYDLPAHWSADYFTNEILRASGANARARLTIWRSPGGLYNPLDDTPQFLISTKELFSNTFEASEGLSIGLCEGVRLTVDSLSGCKTLNGVRYVAAAKEAHAKGWDDAILLNCWNRVCEATSSNIFWITDRQVCTVPLNDGPVTGVLRDLLLQVLPNAGYNVLEKSISYPELLEADEVFFTNAIRGIRWVRQCEGKVFEQTHSAQFNYLLAARLREILSAGK